MVTEFLVALQFLTVIRLRRTLPFENDTLGRAGAFFPAVGVFLGGIVWGLDKTCSFFLPDSLTNVLIVAALAWFSRGLHLDGLADSVDGLLGSADRQRSLTIMKDSRIGTFGALALLGVAFLKLRALDLLLGDSRTQALLLSPMLARWACVLMAYTASPARNEGLGALFMQGVHLREVTFATVFTFMVGLLEAGPMHIPLLALLASITLIATRYCAYRLGGVTGDTMGAIGEIVETVAFCTFASFAGSGAGP